MIAVILILVFFLFQFFWVFFGIVCVRMCVLLLCRVCSITIKAGICRERILCAFCRCVLCLLVVCCLFVLLLLGVCVGGRVGSVRGMAVSYTHLTLPTNHRV